MKSIQVIVTDLNMPKMSGVDMIQEIRKFEKELKIPKTPIIIITGFIIILLLQ